MDKITRVLNEIILEAKNSIVGTDAVWQGQGKKKHKHYEEIGVITAVDGKRVTIRFKDGTSVTEVPNTDYRLVGSKK